MRGVGGVLTPNKKGDIRYQLVGWVERSETQRMESSAIRLKVSELARVKGKGTSSEGRGTRRRRRFNAEKMKILDISG